MRTSELFSPLVRLRPKSCDKSCCASWGFLGDTGPHPSETPILMGDPASPTLDLEKLGKREMDGAERHLMVLRE